MFHTRICSYIDDIDRDCVSYYPNNTKYLLNPHPLQNKNEYSNNRLQMFHTQAFTFVKPLY